jgi:copper oxidase (laccase) domain-containing protein
MPLLRSALLLDRGFSHAFPTRDVTDGALLEGLGGQVDRIVQARQVHGARVVEATACLASPGEAARQEADALVARGKAGPRVVGVRVADCVPVLVGDAASGDVAAIHAGWRGVVAGVVPAAVAVLRSRRAGGGARWTNHEQAHDLSAAPGVIGEQASDRHVTAAPVDAFGIANDARGRAADRTAGPGELVAAIGPCIGACCFEVGREVAARIGHVAR